MEDRVILLVEDNADDELLTLRALKKNNIRNEVVVARDGNEALDFLFGTGVHSGRDLSVMPQIILLDLKLAGLEEAAALTQIEFAFNAKIREALGEAADLQQRFLHDQVPACKVTSDTGRQRSSRRSTAFTLQLPMNTMQVVATSATKIPVVSKFIAPNWIR